MTPAKASTAIGIMVIAATGLVVTAVATPGIRKLHMGFEGTLSETRRYAEQLLDSPIAHCFDPHGDANLRQALAMDDKAAHGGLELSDLLTVDDTTMATDKHQIQIHDTRLALMLMFGGLLVGSLGCFILWRRDSRSELWHLASLPISGALFPLVYIAIETTWLGVVVIPIYMTALVTVGRESVRAFRLRTPDEIP